MSPRTWWVFLALGALASMHVVVLPESWLSIGLYDGIGLAAVGAIVVGAVRNRAPARSTWLLLAGTGVRNAASRMLAAGMVLVLVSDLIYALMAQAGTYTASSAVAGIGSSPPRPPLSGWPPPARAAAAWPPARRRSR